jgi:Peptidase_C39 like family
MAELIHLVDVIKYWNGSKRQLEAIRFLQSALEEDPIVLDKFTELWRMKPLNAEVETRVVASGGMGIQTVTSVIASPQATNKFATPFAADQYEKLCEYAKSGVANVDTKTTYYSQRDNYVMGGRTCNSSSCAMWVNWLRLATGGQSLGGDDDYLRKLLSIGDTIYHESQSECIERYYGFKSTWIDVDEPAEKDFAQVDGLLDSGFPVVVNISHRGTITAPRGGHIIMLIARRKSEGTYIAHDPYGTLSSDYENENGRASLISRADFRARWQGGRRVLA